MTKWSPAPGRPHRSAGSRQDIADGGGYGGRGLAAGPCPVSTSRNSAFGKQLARTS